MILVYADHDRGVLDELSLQAITFARGLTDDVQVVIGGESADVIAALGAFGVSTVHVCAVDDYAPQAIGRAIASLAGSTSPQAILAVGGPRGNEVLAHTSAILNVPMAAECTSVTLGAGQHDVVRNRWGGNLLETATVKSGVLVASIAAHTVSAEPTAAVTANVVAIPVDLAPNDLVVRVLDRVGGGGGGVSLAEAKVIVSGGRGVGGPEGFDSLEQLAELLGGTIGCSRVVTSNGWRPHHEQVGQTGTKVAPDLYIACGISGATQHIAGCRNSKTIIAINTDPEAPIMAFAHYAIVGDVSSIMPALVEATRSAKG